MIRDSHFASFLNTYTPEGIPAAIGQQFGSPVSLRLLSRINRSRVGLALAQLEIMKHRQRTTGHIPRNHSGGSDSEGLWGYGIRYGVLSTPVGPYDDAGRGTYTELMLPLAFSESVQSRQPITLNLGHRDDAILASTEDGSLTLENSDAGVVFRATRLNGQLGPKAIAGIRDGTLAGVSPRFVIERETWDTDDNGYPCRLILSATLKHIALVRQGIYPQCYAIIVSGGIR